MVSGCEAMYCQQTYIVTHRVCACQYNYIERQVNVFGYRVIDTKEYVCYSAAR